VAVLCMASGGIVRPPCPRLACHRACLQLDMKSAEKSVSSEGSRWCQNVSLQYNSFRPTAARLDHQFSKGCKQREDGRRRQLINAAAQSRLC